jgi:small conductance mechanosensitive channel
MNEQAATLNHARDTLIDLAIRFGPRLLTALLILGVGVAASRWVSRVLARALSHRELEPPIRLLLTRVAAAACMVLFVIMSLQNLGVELLPLIAGLGVAGAGLALATQGVLSNVMAGLSIIFSKPFRVGEYIAIAGVEGVVQGITLFSTTLVHVDHSHVVVPNRKIVGEILHNYGRIRQLDVSVGVAYDTDLPRALALIEEVLRANARILTEPAAVVQPVQLGDSSVGIAVRPWVLVEDLTAAGGEITAAVLAAFNSRGVVIPVPQREVRLVGGRPPSS